MNIHGITAGRVDRLAFYAKTSPTPPINKRGKQPNPRAKPDELKQQVHVHIASFPTIQSHYARAYTSKGRKYLSPHLSVAQMHEMYLELHEPQEYAKLKAGDDASPKISYDYYRNYFNVNFNLSFGVPKTDTCSKCDELNVQINDACDPMERQRFQAEKQVHL